jgi:hypothetical protein
MESVTFLSKQNDDFFELKVFSKLSTFLGVKTILA